MGGVSRILKEEGRQKVNGGWKKVEELSKAINADHFFLCRFYFQPFNF